MTDISALGMTEAVPDRSGHGDHLALSCPAATGAVAVIMFPATQNPAAPRRAMGGRTLCATLEVTKLAIGDAFRLAQ